MFFFFFFSSCSLNVLSLNKILSEGFIYARIFLWEVQHSDTICSEKRTQLHHCGEKTRKLKQACSWSCLLHFNLKDLKRKMKWVGYNTRVTPEGMSWIQHIVMLFRTAHFFFLSLVVYTLGKFKLFVVFWHIFKISNRSYIQHLVIIITQSDLSIGSLFFATNGNNSASTTSLAS